MAFGAIFCVSITTSIGLWSIEFCRSANDCLLIELDSEGEIAIIGSKCQRKKKLEIVVDVLLFVKQSE